MRKLQQHIQDASTPHDDLSVTEKYTGISVVIIKVHVIRMNGTI